jgi:hypothetical protein
MAPFLRHSTAVTTDKKVTEVLKSVDGTDVLWQVHCNREAEAAAPLQSILLFQSACWIPAALCLTVGVCCRTHVISAEVHTRTGGFASRLSYGAGCTSSSSPSATTTTTQSRRVQPPAACPCPAADSPCSGDNCPGTICGRIAKSNSAQT